VTLADLPVEWLLAIVAAILAAGAGVAGIWAWQRHRARRALLDRIESVAAEFLQDVVLPDGAGGWFHVDFLLLTGMGLVVVDLRDVPGLIFGSEQMTEWTVMHKNQRFTFPNPLGSLYDRMAVVRALVGENVPVEGRVVFTDRGSFPKGHPRAVTRLASLALEIPPLAVAGRDELLARLAPAWAQVRAAASPSPLKRR
jgi:Nuclease-related domain